MVAVEQGLTHPELLEVVDQVEELLVEKVVLNQLQMLVQQTLVVDQVEDLVQDHLEMVALV